MSDSNTGEFILYASEDGELKIDVRLLDETVWLTQKQMAEMFQKNVSTINEHLKNIFDEGELDQNSTIRNFRIVQQEGERSIERDVQHYNLDVIISVGYRVKSLRGTQFRIWVNSVLKDYLLKGYAINQRINNLERKVNEHDEKFKLLIHSCPHGYDPDARICNPKL